MSTYARIKKVLQDSGAVTCREQEVPTMGKALYLSSIEVVTSPNFTLMKEDPAALSCVIRDTGSSANDARLYIWVMLKETMLFTSTSVLIKDLVVTEDNEWQSIIMVETLDNSIISLKSQFKPDV